MIAGESRGVTGDCKVEGQVSNRKPFITPSFCYSGIDLTDEIKTPTFLAIFVTDSAHKNLDPAHHFSGVNSIVPRAIGIALCAVIGRHYCTPLLGVRRVIRRRQTRR